MSSSSDAPQYAIPVDTLAEFQSNSWTSSFLASPHYTPVETTSRTTKRRSGEDAYFADTLGTPSTIPSLLSLRLTNPSTPPTIPPSLPAPPAKPPTPQTRPEMIALVSLGSPGISGHPNTAHGGVVMTVLDEVLSLAVAVQVPGYDLDLPEERGRLYTSQLDVRFLRPVYVPAKCVIKAWCVAKDGRKFWMRGQLIQEDGLGEAEGGSIEAVRRKRVCADAVGFWVQTRSQKL